MTLPTRFGRMKLSKKVIGGANDPTFRRDRQPEAKGTVYKNEGRVIMITGVGRMKISILAVVSIVLFLVVSCSTTTVVHIGSPYDRYDHNRTRAILISSTTGSAERIPKVPEETYRPSGSEYFPMAKYAESDGSDDCLPAANIVPIFTGVHLPLSNAEVKGGRSDREDLIDFLAVASGPQAQVGVEPSSTTGNTRYAEIAYDPVLAFLASKEQLSEGRDRVIHRLSSMSVGFADDLVDSRYRLPGGFTDFLAFRFKKFWFILYQLRNKDHYSRLVIVRESEKGKTDSSDKKPY